MPRYGFDHKEGFPFQKEMEQTIAEVEGRRKKTQQSAKKKNPAGVKKRGK